MPAFDPRLTLLRREHPAWLLLSARTGPALISTLQTLFDEDLKGIEMHVAQQRLAEQLRRAHEAGEIESDGDYARQARRELNAWIRRALILERDGRIIATDALESVFRFVDGLDNRIMTSTASRLSVVQRELESLELRLSPDPAHREALLERQIAELQDRLAEVRRGDFEPLPEDAAIEAIREVYTLAMGLRQDFRRVEDSYREADRRLRETMIARDSHRGDIVDTLLDSHDALLDTDEGKVFDAFQQQLKRKVELDAMRQHLRALTRRPESLKALDPEQHTALRWLFFRLNKESDSVLDARARGEHDLRAFMRTGLATEHHRVGQLLNTLFEHAAGIDWQRQGVRRAPSSLPPVGIPNPALPLIERLRFKDLAAGERPELELVEQSADLSALDDAFWDGFASLDRDALLTETRAILAAADAPLSIAEIARRIAPEHYVEHDLEALTLWLTVAMEAELPMPATEQLELDHDDGQRLRYTLPLAELDLATLDRIELEL